MTTPPEAGCACGWHGDADAADDHPCTLPDHELTLVEFLRARIAEDKALAEAAGGQEWYPVLVPPPAMRRTPDEETHWGVDSPASLVSYEVTSRDKAGHIADWSPARVLAECEAKRQLIELLTEPRYCDAFPRCSSCDEEEEAKALGILALPHADHPDYQESWRP